MTGEREMYKLVCEDRFDNIDKKQQEMLDLLRGKNSSAGLVEKVRVLEGRWKVLLGGLGIVIFALIGQFVKWAWETL